jgi:hypothetical protein
LSNVLLPSGGLPNNDGNGNLSQRIQELKTKKKEEQRQPVLKIPLASQQFQCQSEQLTKDSISKVAIAA